MLKNMFNMKQLEGDKATMDGVTTAYSRIKSFILQLEGKRTFLEISTTTITSPFQNRYWIIFI